MQLFIVGLVGLVACLRREAVADGGSRHCQLPFSRRQEARLAQCVCMCMASWLTLRLLLPSGIQIFPSKETLAAKQVCRVMLC